MIYNDVHNILTLVGHPLSLLTVNLWDVCPGISLISVKLKYDSKYF